MMNCFLQIPRINEPRTLWEKFLDYLEQNRRDPQKVSVSNILKPSTMKELVLEEKSPLSPPSPSNEMEAVKGIETTLADCQNESPNNVETDAEFIEDEEGTYSDEEYQHYQEGEEEEEMEVTNSADERKPQSIETLKPGAEVDLKSNYHTTTVIFTGSEPEEASEHFRSFSPTNKQVPSTYSANRLSYD